jgi:2'-5' RNA ligase
MSVQKYFIAIVIPEPFQTQLMDLKNVVKDKYTSKGALRSPAHITLHMPFEWKEDKETVLVNTLQQFTFSENFNIDLQNFACFEPRVLFVDVMKNELLGKLQHELMGYAQNNLRLLNQVNDMRGFNPHVTIAFRDLKKDKFYQALDYFKNQTYSASFQAKSFCLLKHTGKEWLVNKEFFFANT